MTRWALFWLDWTRCSDWMTHVVLKIFTLPCYLHSATWISGLHTEIINSASRENGADLMDNKHPEWRVVFGAPRRKRRVGEQTRYAPVFPVGFH